MHIGGVSIIDPRRADGSLLDFNQLREHVASRAAAVPVLRRRLATVPFGLGRPSWVDDGDPDLEYHLERTSLPEPGGLRELRALASFEFARSLDRRRPLWSLLWVEGLGSVPGAPPGAVALISRVHHAAVDGVSGAEILAALLGPPPAPAPATAPASGVIGRLGRAGRELAGIPLAIPGAVASVAKGLAGGALAAFATRVAPPPLPFSAPPTRFNAPVTAERSWAATTTSLERFKAIKDEAGATVNDVVLAVCAGALRRWLLERDELPREPLVAMIPISIRGEEGRGRMGNRVSAMLVSLATDVGDAQARLATIRDGARSAKIYHRAVGADALAEGAALVPFGLAGIAARVYAGLHLAERHRPLFNVTITNVPGPREALDLAGAPLLSHAGQAPVFDGLGLIMPIFSYAGTISLAATACARMVPRAASIAEAFEASLDELEAAVLGPTRPAGSPTA